MRTCFGWVYSVNLVRSLVVGLRRGRGVGGGDGAWAVEAGGGGGEADLLVDGSEDAELAEADVERGASELDVARVGWALDDDDINRA